jgi:hypothetical protein
LFSKINNFDFGLDSQLARQSSECRVAYDAVRAAAGNQFL